MGRIGWKCTKKHIGELIWQKMTIIHNMKWETIPKGDFMNNKCCCGCNPPQAITKYVCTAGPQGPQGPAGKDGIATLSASTNRRDTVQTVTAGSTVSITGTNVLTNDSDMLFVNNTVRLNSTGLYLITTTLEITDNAGTYNFSITVDNADYDFIITVMEDNIIGITSHTVYLNITTAPTVVSITNRNNSSITANKAELDIVKLA